MEIKELSDAELAAADQAAYAAYCKAIETKEKLGAAWLPYRHEIEHRQLKAEIRKEMEKEHGTTQQPNSCCSAYRA